MNEYICDDRMDLSEMRERICSMTDEEFEEYLRKEYSEKESNTTRRIQRV